MVTKPIAAPLGSSLNLTCDHNGGNINLQCTYLFTLVPIKERGDIRLFNKLVQTFYICLLNNFGEFLWILISLFNKLSVQTFQPLIVIYLQRGIFVYHHWG